MCINYKHRRKLLSSLSPRKKILGRCAYQIVRATLLALDAAIMHGFPPAQISRHLTSANNKVDISLAVEWLRLNACRAMKHMHTHTGYIYIFLNPTAANEST